MNPLKALLLSRKFWLAMLGVVQTVVFQFFPQIPQEVWIAINALLMAVIVGITVEDAAEKAAPTNIIQSSSAPSAPSDEAQG